MLVSVFSSSLKSNVHVTVFPEDLNNSPKPKSCTDNVHTSSFANEIETLTLVVLFSLTGNSFKSITTLLDVFPIGVI